MTIAFFRDEAESELRDACDWYERQVEGLGERLRAFVAESVQRACENPGAFPTYDGELRRIRVNPFPVALFYVIRRDYLVIAAVLDLRRDPEAILRRLRREL